ncbi:MAG: hydroxymethylbilane synthase, partial [Thermoplasmata archaeon]
MSLRFRVGTRGSALARAQCALAVRRLARAIPAATFETVVVETEGDRDRRAGVALDFTSALERQLRRREIDLAIHSTKDLAARDPPDLGIVAYPPRADPRDCLVAARGALARGGSVGSSSLRRRAQLARWRPDLSIREIRGNVDTRIRAVRSGRLDAVIVARAGLVRLRRGREATTVLPWKRFVPSPGQGAIAIEMRRRDPRVATV